jgi:hypothetical protein
MPEMSDRNLRTLVGLMLGAFMVVVAVTLVVLAGRNDTPSASPSTSAGVGSSATASGSPTLAPSGPASPGPSTPVASTPAASSSAEASSSPLPAPLASLTFLGLKLDASADPAAQPRTITFRSDGAGTITAKLASSTPQGTTHMCLKVGAKVIGCNDMASGTFTGKSSQTHANWQVTLVGTGTATPVVDVMVTFQAVAPSVAIAHARFDGTDFPDTNGIQVRVTARAAGDLHLVGSWGGHPFPYDIDLFDEASGTGNATFPNQGPSTNVDRSFPIGAGDWRMVLQNSETGFGITDLSARIDWP